MKTKKLNKIQLDKNTIVYSKYSEKHVREAFKTRRLSFSRFYHDYEHDLPITA
jgi:hypothetical protein